MLPEDKIATRYLLSLGCAVIAMAVLWVLFRDEILAGLYMP